MARDSNNSIIARTLREEFSWLEIAECSRYSQADEEHFHASELAYDWSKISMTNYCSRDASNDYTHGAVDDIKPSSSSCSPCEVGEFSLELIDNYPLDDKIERRLSQITPILKDQKE